MEVVSFEGWFKGDKATVEMLKQWDESLVLAPPCDFGDMGFRSKGHQHFVYMFLMLHNTI